jgi:hypothetical protein
MITFAEAIREALDEELARDEREFEPARDPGRVDVLLGRAVALERVERAAQ